VEAASRLVADAEQRFNARLAEHGIAPPPSRAERAAAAREAKERRQLEQAERTAGKKRKAQARVDHEGRALPPLPLVTRPILWHEPEADVVLSAMRIFPRSHPWNEDISTRPVHPVSSAMLERLGDAPLQIHYGGNFIIVPPGQPLVPVALEYVGESDPGPYPLPDNSPIESWGAWWEKQPDLATVQRAGEGDRHVIILDPHNQELIEFFHMFRTDAGWTGTCAARFRLDSNAMRPDRWTSADASGMAMFPGYIRHDELERGVIEHALRVTMRQTRREYIYPASHWAATSDDPLLPAMGQRFRLKASYDISRFAPHARVVAAALQTYGMLVADNGETLAVGAMLDRRIDDGAMKSLDVIRTSDFEVVLTTGPEEGPRAPGAR
ncbi:MAG: hypothetical protein H0X45_09780, partial [Planctomycetes bacterium]|nr:hypothetical protein [Planctomycetota bacterium]